MQAAAASVSPAAAPDVTQPASAPVASAISPPAHACRSSMRQLDCAASSIAARVRALIAPPPRVVTKPAAEMTRAIPIADIAQSYRRPVLPRGPLGRHASSVLTLYDNRGSTNAIKVRFLLAELGLDYETMRRAALPTSRPGTPRSTPST